MTMMNRVLTILEMFLILHTMLVPTAYLHMLCLRSKFLVSSLLMLTVYMEIVYASKLLCFNIDVYDILPGLVLQCFALKIKKSSGCLLCVSV